VQIVVAKHDFKEIENITKSKAHWQGIEKVAKLKMNGEIN
jgi:hypothetical protein